MQLRTIEYFLAIAEHLSFHKAADALGLSQPALTMQLRSLEESLGVKLFVRNRQQVSLTFAGSIFRENAILLARRVRDAGLRTRRAARGFIETMHIGFISSFATSHLLSSLIGRFSKAHPEVALELKNRSTVQQLAMLAKQEIDIGFFRLPVAAPPAVRVVPIHWEPLVLYLPASHPLAEKKNPTLRDFASSPFILYARHSAPGYYDMVMKVMENAGLSPRIDQEVSEIYTIDVSGFRRSWGCSGAVVRRQI